MNSFNATLIRALQIYALPHTLWLHASYVDMYVAGTTLQTAETEHVTCLLMQICAGSPLTNCLRLVDKHSIFILEKGSTVHFNPYF